MNETYLERIDAYLSGDMSRDEQLQFESEIETNEELALVFRIYRTIETEMGSREKNKEAEASLRKTLEDVGAKYFKTEPENIAEGDNLKPVASTSEDDISSPAIVDSPRQEKAQIRAIHPWKRWLAAAAILGIIALSVTWYIGNENRNRNDVVENKKPGSSPNNNAQKNDSDTTESTNSGLPVARSGEIQKIDLSDEGSMIVKDGHKTIISLSVTKRNALVAEYFKPDLVPADVPETLQPALDHLKEKEFQQTIASIDMIPRTKGVRTEQTEKEERIAFYRYYLKGQSYLALRNSVKAIPELKAAIDVGPDDNLLKSGAQWYLALAYLKQGDIKNVTRLLNELAKNQQAAKYKTMSQKLRKQIEGDRQF